MNNKNYVTDLIFTIPNPALLKPGDVTQFSKTVDINPFPDMDTYLVRAFSKDKTWPNGTKMGYVRKKCSHLCNTPAIAAIQIRSNGTRAV